MALLRPFDAGYTSAKLEVSVAVIRKREGDERMLAAEYNQGGELTVSGAEEELEAALDGVRSGDWMLLAGVDPTSGRMMLKWYRMLSLDDENDTTGTVAVRRAMLDGPEWPRNPDATPANQYPVQELRAIFIPGVVSVGTQLLPLEQ
jgi:hypothetical protein